MAFLAANHSSLDNDIPAVQLYATPAKLRRSRRPAQRKRPEPAALVERCRVEPAALATNHSIPVGDATLGQGT